MPLSVEAICQQLVKNPKLISNCNEYIQAVAAKVASEYKRNDIPSAFDGDADTIRGRFSSPSTPEAPFIYIGKNPGTATQKANEGQFVIGGLTKAEMTYTGRDGTARVATMGHVVVVAPGGPSPQGQITMPDGTSQAVRGGYPYCYQGAHYSRYQFTERTEVDAVFPALRLDWVVYAYIKIK